MKILSFIRIFFISFYWLNFHIYNISAMFPFPSLNFSSFTTKGYETINSCVDFSPECEERRSLCKNESFAHIMRKKCKKTCNACKFKKQWLSFNKSENSRPIMLPNKTSRNESLQLSFHPGFSLTARQNESLKDNVANSLKTIEKDDLRKDSEEIDFQPSNIEIKIDEDYLLASNRIQNLLQQAPFFNFLEIQNAKIHAPSKPNEITVQGRIAASLPATSPLIPKQLKKEHSINSQQCVDHSGWECRWKRHLCQNIFYITVMRRNCAKTCGFCKKKKKPKPGGYPTKNTWTFPHMKSNNKKLESFVPNQNSQFSPFLPSNIIFPSSTPRFSPNIPQFRIPKPGPNQFIGQFGNMGAVFPEQHHQNMLANRQNSFFNHFFVPCSNRALDCEEKVHLCTDQHYWKLMQKMCALSCNVNSCEYL